MNWHRTKLGLLPLVWHWLLLLAAVAFGAGLFAGRASAQEIPRAAHQYRGELTRIAHAVWGLDAPIPLFAAQIHQESGWNPAAVSKVGAQGMAQFMPATARWWCELRAVPTSACVPTNPAWAMRALVEYDLWLYQRVYGDNPYDRLWAMFRTYNGGLGHWQREAAIALPMTSRMAIDAACGRAKRNAVFCPENLGYAKYVHTSIEHPRLEHKAWDGTILPLDSPWWATHTPQNGWGCKCKKYSLSRVEATREWEKKGRTGPDEEPAIEWEERVVGKNGSNPRTVRVPKGIDPGFAYNPGQAWLEPNTVPPLQGYDAVLKERGATWPTAARPATAPKPTVVPRSDLVPAGTKPEVAVADFLDVFGADMEHGAAFTDAAGSTVAISKALFQDGRGQFKWLARPDKADRMEYANLLAMTLIEPDEIWWAWVKDAGEKGRWRLKRRYLKAFELEGSKEFGVGVFEWGDNGWDGATAFMGSQNSEAARAAYFDRQRNGRLVFKKD